MLMLSAIGQLEDIDIVSDEMVKCGCVHVVNAMDDLKHMDIKDMGQLSIIKRDRNNNKIMKARDALIETMEVLEIERVLDKIYAEDDDDLPGISEEIFKIHKEAMECSEKLNKAIDELNSSTELKNNVENIKELRFAVSELKNLNYFKFSIGKVKRDYYAKLKENIENIPSIIYSLTSTKGYNVILSFTPEFTMQETEGIFRSLGYEEIIIPDSVRDVPENVINRLQEHIEKKENEANKIKDEKQLLQQKHFDFITRSFNLLEKYAKSQDINGTSACSEHLFYLTGWVPLSQRKGMEKRLQCIQDKLVLVFREQSEVLSTSPPTKLNNNAIFRPFEYLVNMYGIPAYNEADPTSFVAISYMLMFGAMFGDVGQGFVLFAGGLYLSMVKKSYEFGGILVRVGISSMIFGVIYGSVFGSENIIKPVIPPLENINTILFGGVVLGIVLSTIGYIYNFVNSIRGRELEDGVFGREGVAGFLFFYAALLAALGVFMKGSPLLPIPLSIIILAVLLLLIVLKQPLSRLIEKKRPLHHDSIADYYVESLFGMIETVLSILSKTISFVRLGAFALNHAGLFVAFSTIASMIRNSAGSFIVLVIGNLVIIGLEGLVVFIQGLRLLYYELFSRFYRGDGVEYSPVKLIYDIEKKYE